MLSTEAVGRLLQATHAQLEDVETHSFHVGYQQSSFESIAHAGEIFYRLGGLYRTDNARYGGHDTNDRTLFGRLRIEIVII